MKKMYIVINSDLNMSPGKVGAQVAHAVYDYLYNKILDIVSCSYETEIIVHEIIDLKYDLMSFKNNGDTVCILKAKEAQLLKFREKGYLTIVDRGLTEIPKDSITCVNLGIFDDDDISSTIKRLRLY
ncbi:peptidyl-tRNA hydrolase [Clostridioides sp. ES-S-0049-02]|uniref:aminoacyl-tRNA hydrolase n=1 Tax=Clostridioides sp. ES-S-0049-02 TaxID=2770778 RepID=UPI001D113F78|nr:peptidyl-tRNA hydrolase [Clostridioides sp. ES-S-0049-02]